MTVPRLSPHLVRKATKVHIILLLTWLCSPFSLAEDRSRLKDGQSHSYSTSRFPWIEIEPDQQNKLFDFVHRPEPQWEQQLTPSDKKIRNYILEDGEDQQDLSEFQFVADRTFNFDEPKKLTEQLADILEAKQFRIERADSKGIIAHKYDSKESNDHDTILVVTTLDDSSQKSINVHVRYFRSRLVAQNIYQVDLVIPDGQVRERFDEVMIAFDALRKTFRNQQSHEPPP
jgi:hypothetical protein